jgi:outer membrane protein assembly factor BamA
MRRPDSVFLPVLMLMLAGVLPAQTAPKPPDGIRIRRLTIESTTLPAAHREQIIREFQGSTYPVPETLASFSEEMQGRVRDSLQRLAYFKALAAEPRISFVKRAGNGGVIDMTVAVHEGLRYRLGRITFTGGTVYPTERLRKAVPMETGELFNTEKMRQGIKNLRDLYASYLNFTPVPDTTIDDLRGTVDVTFYLDEGSLFRFGPLVLDGAEPHPGAGKALLESWKALQGQPYNPKRLQQWFVDNRSNLPPNPRRLMEISQDNTASIVTVRLWLP